MRRWQLWIILAAVVSLAILGGLLYLAFGDFPVPAKPVEKVIPASKAALFFQIDRRLYLLLDLQVSTLHPLTTQ